MSDEAPSNDQAVPVFPQYAPPGLTIADPRQAKPLMKIMNRMLHPRPSPRTSPVSRVRKRVDNRKRTKDKGY